ncbi:anthranilate synthase component II [Leptospira wolffii]|uniref:Anthranilate synthase component II n=1 Tax=Leptospira wolffii TaxID=409998 RepID=A0ABV5BIY5_9LEPT|nr:aminodeoxychorismate/anthranilate synthase component II [Leptospira wolffii]TGK62193.1 aminodeoxychorismate/anthranilate synthase component II [Leptospira wolffii]TGK66564.1 aminodeoxychorismate/anthranilate synthase component II [Leptospira wolffii]TGK74423.1 aminodeoxychorismate/anthranilate synthase component II [Leptospira wolffii]TGL32002.1 aminodeoxychorismate/anthranilate synthase component II [Leptospira wolffii]
MILLVDNYDSFTYNLYQYFSQIGNKVEVFRNDKIDLNHIKELTPKGIVLSPGPGRPEDSGVCIDILKEMTGTLPILGVCLGHQAIGLVHGGKVVNAPSIMHGKVSLIEHDGKDIYKAIPSPFLATRYHSLVIEPESLPSVLEVSSKTQDGVIMGVRHKTKPHLYGVQFHPESIMTQNGLELVRNFSRIVSEA